MAIFSMRGDYAPIDKINEVIGPYREQSRDGVIIVVDDSDGIGAYGQTIQQTHLFRTLLQNFCNKKQETEEGCLKLYA